MNPVPSAANAAKFFEEEIEGFLTKESDFLESVSPLVTNRRWRYDPIADELSLTLETRFRRFNLVFSHALKWRHLGEYIYLHDDGVSVCEWRWLIDRRIEIARHIRNAVGDLTGYTLKSLGDIQRGER